MEWPCPRTATPQYPVMRPPNGHSQQGTRACHVGPVCLQGNVAAEHPCRSDSPSDLFIPMNVKSSRRNVVQDSANTGAAAHPKTSGLSGPPICVSSCVSIISRIFRTKSFYDKQRKRVKRRSCGGATNASQANPHIATDVL